MREIMMQFGGLKLKRCRRGWMLFTSPYIGTCFDLYGEYSESEIALMSRFLRPGDTVVDVGAFIGDLTVPLAGIVGDAGRVYAVESNPEMYHVLCANLALNGIRNVRAINAFVATGSHVDTSGPWGPHAYTGEVWEPQFVSLDALNLPACHLVKVDVDGKELEVFQSGVGLLRKYRPILYFENDQQHASPALLAHLIEAEYDLYWHSAPIFSPDNYFRNPENHWAPKCIVSLMMLGIPKERGIHIADLRRVSSPTEWWVL